MPTSDRVLDKYSPNNLPSQGAQFPTENNKGDPKATGSINYFKYPETIQNDDYSPHAVYFYINMRGKSKYKQYEQNTRPLSNKDYGNSLTPQQIKDTGELQTGALIGTVAGLGAQSAIQNMGGGGGGPKGSISRKWQGLAIVGGVAAAGLAAGLGTAAVTAALDKLEEMAGGKAALSLDQPVRISDVIVLPMEQRPAVKYSVKYREQDMGMFAAFARNLDTATASGELALDAGAMILSSIAQAPTLFGLPNPVQTLLRSGATAINPYKEVFFEGVNFRSFNFNYTFLPKSKKEVVSVMNIIDLFKFHMHPEYSGTSGSSAFLLYPSFFNIEYHQSIKGQDVENKYLNKISNCVLTDMTVNYGGEYFSTFEDGAPAEIYMKLNFSETELLTKERIVQGY